MLNDALSLFVIVPVADAVAMVTLRPPSFRPLNVAENVSLASTLLSLVVLTVTVLDVSPAAKTTVCVVTAE